jgi:hypothetical protein
MKIWACILIVVAGATAPAQSPGLAERRALVQQLDRTVIEEVKFDRATVDDWVGFLRESLKGGDRPVNFIITPAARTFAEGRRATLELKKVPARVLLEYGARLLELEVRIEPHAIVVDAPMTLPPAQSP